MEKEKKIYIGSAKSIKDFLIGGSICVTDIPKEWIKESQKNHKKYLRINIVKRKQPDKQGNDWSISVNTWTPEKKEPLPEPGDQCPW